MTNKLKVHKQEKIIISIVYCLSIYFDENIMLAKQMVFFVSTCNNKLSSVMEIIYGTAIRLQLFFYESWMDHSQDQTKALPVQLADQLFPCSLL
jgi:hypothetical protein